MKREPRTLYVAMDDVLDALDSRGDSPSFFLDLETGQVAIWIDPLITGEENDIDPDDARYAAIPKVRSVDEHRAMEDFVDGLEEDDIQAALRRSLKGKGAFSRFRDVLTGYPDLVARWQEQKCALLLKEALAWLGDLGIAPQFEVRPLPVPSRPAGRPQAPPGQALVGLFDLLLLGAPDGKTELREGQVRRRFVARGEEQARKVFARLARELCEHHGISWRKRFIENTDRYEVERCSLQISGLEVELSVAVPQAIWDLFAVSGGRA